EKGLVTLPVRGVGWVLAKRGTDCTAVSCSDGEGRIGLWGMGINVAYESPWEPKHETFLFSDRPVYKPGEIAHVKAITRIRQGDALAFGSKPFTAQLTVSDPRDREILTKQVTFSANGTWADNVALPQGAVGWYTLKLQYNRDDVRQPTEDNEGDDSRELANLPLRVDEYKANTFEVQLDGSNFKAEPDRIKVPLKANYYMGKALSQAKATWSASIAADYVPPQEFAEYHFGDAAPWWHYGEDRSDETATEEEEAESWGAHGELVLSDNGTATLDLPPPPLHKEALPQTVYVYADVTDVNQQTIAANTEFKLPGADFIVGAKTASWHAFAGKEFGIDLVAITPQGKGFTAAVPIEVKIERQEWNTVRVQGAGGALVTKNQSVLSTELQTHVQLASKEGQPAAARLAFTPKLGGTYFLTATATDANGKTVLSRIGFYAIGGSGFPWAWDDSARMTLQPDKTTVKPGEEVSIVVKSPFAGTALVTVERNRIHRQFLAPISPENPVIKIPFSEEDVPNAFVSVVVIRGSAHSPQPNPMPEYKIGYCEIKVQSNAQKLFVITSPAEATITPGAKQTITATVADSQGGPVAGAEVTLFAVDEGVLSLMSYETPQPYEFFHAPQALAVTNHTTLDALLKENLAERYRGNKGIIIGGGDGEANVDMLMRKNFVATATWNAALLTDAQGRATATFKAPDSLTRYRIMAIAVKDADKFGTGHSAFIVNKPLMLEPVLPRFAHAGDEVLVKAVLHNTTAQHGEVEAELQLDDKARLIPDARPFALIGLKNRTATNDGRSERRIVSLKPGETTAIAFPVRFLKPGTSVWKWQVKTMQWSDAKPLGDAVESQLEVTHPAPALREVHYFQLTSASPKDNLLKRINPQLLEADGGLRLDFSQSRMSEARDALEHVLHYPYGCVEQTTSNTLPWLALGKYEPMFPDLLQRDKVRAAVKLGAERILQMQTDDGGLAYWPGGTTPELWASAYGGFCLFKAKEWGLPIAQSSLDKLTEWLSAQLRELDLANTQDTSALCDGAFALYALAKANKPEVAYSNVLYARRERLPEVARLFLALSMCVRESPEKQIADLLKPQKDTAKWDRYWLGANTAAGLRLIVAAHLGLTKEGDALADELLQRRNGSGHWGTTFSNAWILLGLSTTERPVKNAAPLSFQLAVGGQQNAMTLPSPMASAGLSAAFTATGPQPTANLTLPDGQSVRARLEVKSWPDLKTFQPVQKGFGITRTYERLTPTGQLEPAEGLRVGDLIVVTLGIDVLQGNRYLALEDSLPSVFEPVNPHFGTQNKREDAKAHDDEWYCDHRELRHDKVLFFTNDGSKLGKFHLKYLARVIAEGDVIAPPARIEAMYQPDHYGLSEIQRVQTLPMSDGRDVVTK
ncbi:MAG: alpha-2-macroglobulin family protein, partial [Roseimicrobium sp.]